MSAPFWYLLVGGVFLVMVGGVTLLKRLPLSTAMIYLAVGFALGPCVLDVTRLDVGTHGPLLEHATEIVVLLSLLSVGLKLRMTYRDPRWSAPLRLATVGMVLTIAFVALLGHWIAGLPLAAGLLLGAVLAPTDPVLASEVQLEHAFDADRLRITLTAEAGLNDGTAFPFAMLGLGLLGLHEIGTGGTRWIGADLIWAPLAGLAIGIFCGRLSTRIVLWLRHRYHESIGLDDFLALGLIAAAYGLALLVGGSGFLAVFAAGLSLRAIERERSPEDLSADNPPDPARLAVVPLANPLNSERLEDDALAADHPALDEERSAEFLAAAVLGFNTQLERIAEVAMVGAVGALLSTAIHVTDGGLRAWGPAVGIAALVLLVARPLATWLCLLGSSAGRRERLLSSWLGVRGVGSLYYLAFAATHGFTGEAMVNVERITLATITLSILLHGTSVTPLMRLCRNQEKPDSPTRSERQAGQRSNSYRCERV